MNIFVIATILGVIEGLTEFIPVSSTGHLILFGKMLAFTGATASSFEICIQLGAILAVVVLYRQRFAALWHDCMNLRKKRTALRPGFSLMHLVIAVVPVVIVGFTLYHVIKEVLFSPVVVAWSLIAGGVIMMLVDGAVSRRKLVAKSVSLDSITYRQAFLVGCLQCFSVCPGVSRSGATIVGGLVSGLDYRTAAEFSFILAVPVMGMAVGYDLLKSWTALSGGDVAVFSLGFIVSFIVAYAAIKFFLALLQQWKLTPFGIYRILLGIGVLVLCK